VRLQLLRHATLVVELAGRRLLVDPMLSPAAALDPVANAGDDRRIPLVELPLSAPELATLLAGLDAALVTHTHRDHWDSVAAATLRRDLPIMCQPPDAAAIAASGFPAVTPVERTAMWEGIALARTGGRHGSGAIGERMGPVSGFVLCAAGEPTLYIAGDTIWCPEVEAALGEHRPDLIVVNAGAAQFLSGDPITMGADDVLAVCRVAPWAQVVAVHMEAVNHCRLSRAALRAAAAAAGLAERLHIPDDGEVIALP
jgi:L-ascorbate metabolism protein UlaG (beta-lactamase superfamily)